MKPKLLLCMLAPALMALMMSYGATPAAAQCCSLFTVDGSSLGTACFRVHFSILWSDGTVQLDSLMGPTVQTYPVLAVCPPSPSAYVISIVPRDNCCIIARINHIPPSNCPEIVLEECR